MLSELKNREFIFFDGALGTMLQKEGLRPGDRPDVMNIQDPDAVERVQRRYVDAGSDIVCTNTFGANRRALSVTPYSPEEIIGAAVGITKRAVSGRAQTALDIGPIGEFMEPAGSLTFDEAYKLFAEQAIAGERAGADIAAIETMSELQELRAAILAVRENTSLPVIALMTFTAAGRTFTGCTPESFALTAEALGADIVGINCSLLPKDVLPVVKKIAAATRLPLCVKPNAGLPSGPDGSYSITPEEYAEQMREFASVGVRVVGGCCGTTPEYISRIREVYASLQPAPRVWEHRQRICSASKTALVEKIIIPIISKFPEDATGAVGGAEERDGVLTVALPRRCTEKDAASIISRVQSESDLPIHIITPDSAGLDGALRAVCGVAAVTAYAGDPLPAAKKYGAPVI